VSNTALFVDLPNFYSRLLKSGIESPRFLRDYFLHWLDFDLLASSLTGANSGIWIFYSGERIGPSSERIEGKFLQEYIRRINALPGVTARDVNIRGEQREPISYKCEQCLHEGISEAVSEKGVDSSLTVHLFDTMDSWNTAFLLSGDADFVPVVASLRRRGKIVIGVGFSDASAALVRECYHYVNIEEAFMNQDVLAYTLYKKDGIVYKWLSNDIQHDPAFVASPTVELRVDWHREGHWGRNEFVPLSPPSYWIAFTYKGSIDLTNRHQMMTELQKKYIGQVEIKRDKNNSVSEYQVSGIPYLGLEAIKRRYRTNLSPINGLVISDKDEDKANCYITYEFNENIGKYESVTDEATRPTPA
jgi:uncharacterized LabA/DUF88 family protein